MVLAFGQPCEGENLVTAVRYLALAFAVLLAFSCSETRATETTRSALQLQNNTSITTNNAGQISGLILHSLLANIIDSTGNLNSANSWTQENIFNATIRLKGYTIGTLPAAGVPGRLAYVTDQLTACPALGATFTPGGNVVCSAFDNGTEWVRE